MTSYCQRWPFLSATQTLSYPGERFLYCGITLYCVIDPTEALNASKNAFKSLSKHLPPNTPKKVWQEMILAVQMICEALEHKPISLDDYQKCQEEAQALLERCLIESK